MSGTYPGTPEGGQMNKMSDKEMKGHAIRNLAWGILPALVNAHPNLAPLKIVNRAYAIAKHTFEKGDKI